MKICEMNRYERNHLLKNHSTFLFCESFKGENQTRLRSKNEKLDLLKILFNESGTILIHRSYKNRSCKSVSYSHAIVLSLNPLNFTLCQ